MTGGAAHLIGTGRGRVAQETQNTRPVWRWVCEGREGREGDGAERRRTRKLAATIF
jgi:hypothetical protein